MKSKVGCKLRIKPTTTGATAPTSGRQSMRTNQPSTKEEPELAEGITRTPTREPVSNGLVFQQLHSTDIAPRTKAEPSDMKQEPKQEPTWNTSNPRPSRPELIILDDDEPIVPKKEEPLIQSSGRCTDSEVIVLDGDDEAVNRPIVGASNAIRSARPSSDASDAEVVNRRRKSDSGSSKRRGGASGGVPSADAADLQDGGDEMKSTLEKYLRIIASTARDEASDTGQEIQGSSGHSRGEIGTDANAARPLLENADSKLLKSSTRISACDGSSVKQAQKDSSTVKREQLIEKRPQPAFETDFPSEWFVASPRKAHNEIDEPLHPTPPPQPGANAEKQKRRRHARSSGRMADSCASDCEDGDNDSGGNHTLAQHPTPQAEVEHSSISQRQADQKSLRQRWRKYWVVDQRRNIHGKRRRPERKVSTEVGTDEHIPGSSVDVSGMKIVAEEESDVDPDEVNFSPAHIPKRRSQGITQRAEKDRDSRAQRRAAEAEGAEVPYSQMLDRKPRIEEHRSNVIIKVREVRKNVEFSFVKPRKAPFRDLREELGLYAEVPPNVKFELKYRNKVIKDADTPQSLGILYTAKIRAVRRERTEDDSSDGVAEVEGKRRRENLIKVTVQDENGKKHTFQHDKRLKFRNLFHAFAKMCQNDIRAYRFFLDGKRLSYDDRPIDCEEFEDGALIDAFFETTGGRGI